MKIYVALENVRSLYNIGAIIRTCSFFDISNIILVGYSGKDYIGDKAYIHEKIKKTSLGSDEDICFTLLDTSEDLINFAKSNTIKLVSVEQTPDSILLENLEQTLILTEDIILVFGNEVTGVSKEVLDNSDLIVEIKRIGKHNSLNITTACGIVLYYLSLHTSLLDKPAKNNIYVE